MADYYMVMSDGVTDGTATGTGGKYTAAEYATIGTDGFADAKTSDWGTKGHATLNEYYYSDIQAAFDAGAGSGDYILASNTHNYSSAVAGAHEIGVATATTVCVVMSVLSTDVSTYTAGAIESLTDSTGDYIWRGYITYVGVSFTWPSLTTTTYTSTSIIFHDATLISTGNTTQTIWFSQDGNSVSLYNSTVKSGRQADGPFGGTAGYTFYWYGGLLTYDTTNGATHLDYLFRWPSSNGGFTVVMVGVDISVVEEYLIEANLGDRAVDDAASYTFKNCKLNASLTGINNEDPESLNQRVSLFNCGSTSAEAEYQFHIVAFGGEVEDDTAVYRDQSVAFPSGIKVSAHVTTVGNVSKGTPFSFELMSRHADFTTYDKIRIYLASASTLYTDKVWVELIYRDQTNNHTPHRLDSKPDDFLAASVELDVDGDSTWTGLVGNNYYIELDIEGNDPGAECVPTVLLHVGEAAATEIYFDTTIEMVA